MQYRESVGFQADQAFVQRADLDAVGFPHRELGIALSDAEYAEIMRRSDIQVASVKAHVYAETLSGFAGMYLDQNDGGKPVFLFVGSQSIDRQAILDKLPMGTEIRIEEARFTLADLEAIQGQVIASEDRLSALGVAVVSEAIDVKHNSVLVGVSGLTDEKGSLIAKMVGPGVTLREDEASTFDGCVDSWKDCFPLKGAVRVQEPNYSLGICTAGFLMKRDGNSQISLSTAGHCFVSSGGQGARWAHGDNQVLIGSASKNTWVENANADVGFIMLDTEDFPADKNQLLYTTSPYVEVAIDSVDTNQTAGESVCRNGSTTGHTCGHIYAINVRHLSCYKDLQGVQYCVHINQTVEVDFDSTGGDSGGPTFWLGTAMGTHIHSGLDSIQGSHGWYGTAQNDTDVYFNMWGARYRYCLNTDCTVTYP